MFELARACNPARVGIAVKTFNNIHMRFKRADDIAQAMLFGIFGQADAPAFALDAFHITGLGQFVYHLHQMIVGNAIVIRNLPHAAQAVLMRREEHEGTESIICKNGQLHTGVIMTQKIPCGDRLIIICIYQAYYKERL